MRLPLNTKLPIFYINVSAIYHKSTEKLSQVASHASSYYYYIITWQPPWPECPLKINTDIANNENHIFLPSDGIVYYCRKVMGLVIVMMKFMVMIMKTTTLTRTTETQYWEDNVVSTRGVTCQALTA